MKRLLIFFTIFLYNTVHFLKSPSLLQDDKTNIFFSTLWFYHFTCKPLSSSLPSLPERKRNSILLYCFLYKLTLSLPQLEETSFWLQVTKYRSKSGLNNIRNLLSHVTKSPKVKQFQDWLIQKHNKGASYWCILLSSMWWLSSSHLSSLGYQMEEEMIDTLDEHWPNPLNRHCPMNIGVTKPIIHPSALGK